MNLGQTILNTFISFIVLFNLTYSASSAYKESVTDEDNQKTINGYLLALFGVFAGFGNVVYKVIRKCNVSTARDRKTKKVDFTFADVLDFFVLYGVSYIVYLIFNVIGGVSSIEDMNTIEKILNVSRYIGNTFIMIMYYGFVFGLFGGDNCRIQETFISCIFDKFKQFGDSLERLGSTDITLKNISNTVYTELDTIKTTGKGTKLNILDYFKTASGRTISTVFEFLSSITSVYVSLRNVITCINIVLFSTVFSAFYWVFTRNMDNQEFTYDLKVLDNVVDTLSNLFWSLIILLIVKVIVKLILHLLPDAVSNNIYKASSSLNKHYRDKLANMSRDNLSKDKFAMKNTPERLLRAARIAGNYYGY